jgi:hypothetical protein
MDYRLTTYQTNGEIRVQHLDHEPTLAELQLEVGGLIELVPTDYWQHDPFFMDRHELKLDMWCDEESLMISDPVVNPFVQPASWGDRIYGDICVVEVLS